MFVTLNPPHPPAADKTIRRLQLAHPVYRYEGVRTCVGVEVVWRSACVSAVCCAHHNSTHLDTLIMCIFCPLPLSPSLTPLLRRPPRTPSPSTALPPMPPRRSCQTSRAVLQEATSTLRVRGPATASTRTASRRVWLWRGCWGRPFPGATASAPAQRWAWAACCGWRCLTGVSCLSVWSWWWLTPLCVARVVCQPAYMIWCVQHSLKLLLFNSLHKPKAHNNLTPCSRSFLRVCTHTIRFARASITIGKLRLILPNGEERHYGGDEASTAPPMAAGEQQM